MKRSLLIVLSAMLVSTFRAEAQPIALVDVTVIPMTENQQLKHQVVVIDEGRITAITKLSKFSAAGHRVIDCSGRYLIPGLWDMHAHVSRLDDSMFGLFIANGVTGIRDMGGDPAVLLPMRDDMNAGSRPGPRMRTAGPILESPRFVQRMRDRGVAESVDATRVAVASPEEAVAAVERLRTLGVDFLKIRTFANRNTYLAIGEAAEASGMKLVGHAGLSYTHLLASGQQSYEHLPSQLLNNKSKEERQIIWQIMAKRGVAVVPTLINYTHSLLLPIEEIESTIEETLDPNDSRHPYVSAPLIESWREQIIDRKESSTPNFDRILEGSLRNLKEMHRVGVHILPGTDMPVLLMYPGLSLHDELSALVELVGMSPHEALLSGTLRSAALLGLDDELGTIEVGKQADLILLNDNPLKDIRKTTHINAVISRGHYYDRAALDALISGNS